MSRFNRKWTTKYFITSVVSKGCALDMPKGSVSVFKGQNIKRRFPAKHANDVTNLF